MTKKPIFYAFVLNGAISNPVFENILRIDNTLLSPRNLLFALQALGNAHDAEPTQDKYKLLMLFLRSSLRAFPDDKYLWHFAGNLANYYGHLPEALALFERGLSLDADDERLRASAQSIRRRLRQNENNPRSALRVSPPDQTMKCHM